MEPGEGPVFLDYLQCDSDSERLLDCPGLYFLPSCSNQDVIGARCNGETTYMITIAIQHVQLTPLPFNSLYRYVLHNGFMTMYRNSLYIGMAMVFRVHGIWPITVNMR